MLYKSVFITLRKQYVRLILLGLIIILSSFLYTAMEYAISGVMEPTETYFEEANQEDFAVSMLNVILEDEINYISTQCPTVVALPQESLPFTLSGLKQVDMGCYYGLLDRRMQLITSTYSDIELEVRESKDIYYSTNGDSYRIKFLKDMDEINKSFFVSGTAPITTNEIAVAETFANLNRLEVGDTLLVDGKNYTISGFVLFPDYNLPMFGKDFILDNKAQTVGLVSDEEFENLDEIVSFEIAGVFKNDMNVDRFETTVLDDYKQQDDLDFVANIVLTENNIRSGAIYAELSGGRAYSILLSLLIASIALMIVGIMVARELQAQRGPIGLLKSMGYTNTQITLPYIVFITILALPTLFIGYYLGTLAAVPYKDLFMSFYLLPSNPIVQTPQTLVVSVVIPLLFIIGLSFLIVRKLLSKNPVVLLKPQVSSNSSFIVRKIGKYLKSLKITSKLKHLLLYRNFIKFSVFLIGMFYAAYLILFSFSMNGIFDRMIYDYYDKTHHEYIGYCNYQSSCEVIGTQEKVIEIPSALLENEEVDLVGLDFDSALHPLYNKKGEEITSSLKDGIIITESLHKLEGINKGDQVLLELGDNQTEFEVVGITYEYAGNKAYMNREELSNIITNNNDYYNTVYSETLLDKDDYMVVVSIQDIIQQADNMQSFMRAFVLAMSIVSIIMGGIIIYILTTMTIEDNFYNISLLKVIGYNEKEVNQIMLGGYNIYGVGVFVFTIPIAIVSFYFMEVIFAQMYNISFPFQFQWWHAFLSIFIYLVIFYIGAYAAKKRLQKVSLQEVMKTYQE